jgi:hypothetical protein
MAAAFVSRKGSAIILLLLLATFCWTQAARAGTPLDADEVKAALKTTTIEEEGFVEHVVAMVNADQLPRSLFESTFLWARKKHRHRFQYFKAALIARAADIGIQL